MGSKPAKLLPLLLVLLGWLEGCAHFSDIDRVGRPWRERLARHPVWLTMTVFDNPPGSFPPSETSVIKRWEVVQKNGRAVALRETTSSSFVGLLDKIRTGERPFTTVDLTRDIDPEKFFPYRGHGLAMRRRFASDRYDFADLDGRRFQIKINGGKGRVVFMPAPNDYFTASNPYDLRDIGIWTTPFGAESELFAHLRKLLLKEDAPQVPGAEASYFLHHDLKVARRIPVVLDPSFPRAFAASVARAVAKWNGALGKDLFRLEPGARRVDAGDCVTGFMLCIRWVGPKELAFTGANGYTELAFDPQSGLVTGGIVSVINDDVTPPFRPMAATDKAHLETLDWDFVADAMLRYGELNGVAHPAPDGYVEYLVLHEMGHFNGFGHNFYTSDATAPARPIASVLTYPPFPVGHKADYIGEADKKRVAIVYKQEKPKANLDYCSTFDAMAPERTREGWYRKPYTCDMFTVGNQAEWYIRLAQKGRFGVFTGFPDLSHLSEDLQTLYREMAEAKRLPPLNLLTRLGFLLGDDAAGNAKNRKRVREYLCSLENERAAIAQQLRDFHGVSLDCGGA